MLRNHLDSERTIERWCWNCLPLAKGYFPAAETCWFFEILSPEVGRTAELDHLWLLPCSGTAWRHPRWGQRQRGEGLSQPHGWQWSPAAPRCSSHHQRCGQQTAGHQHAVLWKQRAFNSESSDLLLTIPENYISSKLQVHFHPFLL